MSVPVGVDTSRPSIARVYDAFLGGKDNYAIDREIQQKIMQAVPEAPVIAVANRRFLNRALRFLAAQTKISQFIDCGSGLPTAENTHQIVQRANRDAHVVYVDNDPVVLAHGRALLVENDNTHLIEADIFKPSAVLGSEAVQKHIDFSEPIGLIHNGTLHHLEGDGGPAIMAEYIDALPSGSFVVFSHFFDPEVPELTALGKRIEQILVQSPMGAGRFRTRAQILEMLPGLELIEPGLVVADEWWSDGPPLRPLSAAARCIAGAVGRKP
jgi:SAM-dependent methyltransferase